MDRLQAMRVFVRVAELGSFTRAASALGLSRARVSEAVQELERELGARLLHRTTRHVGVSDDGRLYYERARQILADLDDAEAAFNGARARGLLRVAMPMALARSFVVPALPSF
ncbi:MAG TPA: LysR family transcriptional regulator, partial [Polyangiaceae bacterium]|nr:LysR family transcriptional regulator [Polyangiaceae bacterium]